MSAPGTSERAGVAERLTELGHRVAICEQVEDPRSARGLVRRDVVEVLTSKADGAGPSRDWLQFVKSARARNKIRQWFSKERREEAIEQGKDAIAKAMRKQHLPIQRLMSHELLDSLATEMRYADVSALYAAVGEGHASAQSVVQRLVSLVGGADGAEEDLAEATIPSHTTVRRPRSGDPGVVVKGASDVWIKLAKCCTPMPGDEILGFVTQVLRVRYEIADLFSSPDRIVVRAVAHGHGVAEIHGAAGAGKPYVVNTLHVYRTEGDKLAEHWGVRDEVGVLIQLGVLPPPQLPTDMAEALP